MSNLIEVKGPQAETYASVKQPRAMSEAKVKDEIKGFLKTLMPYCWWFMPSMMGYGRKGIPDFIGCYKGAFFSIEAKAHAKSEHSPWQIREAQKIQDALGAHWLVHVENLSAFKANFVEYMERRAIQ